MLQEILSRPAVNFPISLNTYFLVFLEAVVLGLLISVIYKKKSLSQDKSFQYSLWLIAPIVATLLLFIGSNLALSIGMVGSLSIIRFRTAIKDPVDLMYLFILIMIGLGCGTQNYVITLLATFCLGAILYFLAGKKSSYNEQHILMVKAPQGNTVEPGLKEIKQKYPQAEVTLLNLSEKQSDATVVLPEGDESWLFELQKKFPHFGFHLLKK